MESMRKKILGTFTAAVPIELHREWLDLAKVTTVEVSSEDSRFPIESVFSDDGAGWRAAEAGDQQIRLIFDEPVSVRRIQLRFYEPTTERTQEFVLRWSGVQSAVLREIVRQQWNFSPTGSTTELEEYCVSLEGVSVLELAIRPDIARKDAVASLASWRVGQ
jgi:hypothetical protein